MSTASLIQKELKTYASKQRAQVSVSFFKTGKGQYGEGDVFIGVSNPDARRVALAHKDISLVEVKKLLYSAIHEERFVALEILVAQYEKGDEKEKKRVVVFYLKHKKQVNNWDLVDTSASYILGHFLFDKKDRRVLSTLARSKNLWDRRIAIIATHYFIQQKDFKDTLSLAELLMKDTEDLMHKAVGWMLREVGKKDEAVLKRFLDKHKSVLPRTTLRYALERLSKRDKERYMKK